MNDKLTRRILSNGFTKSQIQFILYLYDRYTVGDMFHRDDPSINGEYDRFGLIVGCSYYATNRLYKPLVRLGMILPTDKEHYYTLNSALIRNNESST
jgi:hypothetical protein